MNDALCIDQFASPPIDDDFRLFALRIGVYFADNLVEVDEKSGLFHDLKIEHDDGAIAEEHTVGRVEVTEKPELLWNRPELERLYLRLQEEYELPERDRALTRKLELIAQTATTSLGLLEARRSLRVEWYIVILILLRFFSLSTRCSSLGRFDLLGLSLPSIRISPAGARAVHHHGLLAESGHASAPRVCTGKSGARSNRKLKKLTKRLVR